VGRYTSTKGTPIAVDRSCVDDNEAQLRRLRDRVDAAEAADRAVAGITDTLLALNERTGLLINPLRAEHRQEHVDELERVLRSAG